MDPDDGLQPQPMSFDDYLRLDAEHPRPVEYVAGVAYPKYGRSRNHNRISGNVALVLRNRLSESGCHAFTSLMRTHVADDTICYPDVVATCDPADNDEWTIFYPCLIVEVVSPETAEIDLGAKREAYLRLPPLRTYVTVSETERRVERHWRNHETDDWRTQLIGRGVVPLPCPDVELTVEQIYQGLPRAGDE